MNNANDIEATEDFINDQRNWLLEHKATTGLSWNQLASATGIAYGTLSTFGGGNYRGRNDEQARTIYRYRQTLVVQQQLKIEAPDIPDYFETKTSRELMNTLAYAQRGRLVLCAGGPGIGKTTTARQYQASAANVWLLTMHPSIKSVGAIIRETLIAMGDFSSSASARGEELSRFIRSRMKNTGGLLIVDDAQHLKIDQVEEIRTWHDLTGVGIALFGNETVVGRMEGGSNPAAFAQLYSRVAHKMIRPIPLTEDAEAFAEAWGVTGDDLLAFIVEKARKPGGLRSLTFTMESAAMIARSQGEALMLKHVSAAWAQRTSRPVTIA